MATDSEVYKDGKSVIYCAFCLVAYEPEPKIAVTYIAGTAQCAHHAKTKGRYLL